MPSAEHPANQLARAKLNEYNKERVGQELKKEAMNAFRDEEYRKARELLEDVDTKYGVDVTEEVGIIRERGKRLFNEGNNSWSQGFYLEAEIRWRKSLDCFLPTEPWYRTVDTQIRRRVGETP